MTQKKHFQVQLESYLINPGPGKNVLESIQPTAGSKIQFPKEGLNVLYGKRFASEALSLAARNAREKGNLLVPVVIVLSAWRPKEANHWFDTWEGKTVFDLRRIKDKTHASKVAGFWKQYMKEDGMSAKEIQALDCWTHVSYIERFPQYVDRLHREKEFRHIDAFIWSSKENNRVIARATIYNAKNVISVRALSAEPVDVELPSGVSKAA